MRTGFGPRHRAIRRLLRSNNERRPSLNTVRIEDTESGRRLCLDGGITVYSAFYFRDTVLAAVPAQGQLEIDLSGVHEIDSAGLQVMLQLRSRHETSLRFTNHSPTVRRVLKMCKMAAYFGDAGATPPGR